MLEQEKNDGSYYKKKIKMNIIIIERETMYLEKKCTCWNFVLKCQVLKIEATGILNNARKIQKSITKKPNCVQLSPEMSIRVVQWMGVSSALI